MEENRTETDSMEWLVSDIDSSMRLCVLAGISVPDNPKTFLWLLSQDREYRCGVMRDLERFFGESKKEMENGTC